MAESKKRPPLTKKRQAWAEERNGVFRGKPLNVNRAAEERYGETLRHMTEVMAAATERKLAQYFSSSFGVPKHLLGRLKSQYQEWFDNIARRLASQTISGVEKSSKSMLHASLQEMTGGLSLETGTLSGPVAEVVKASIEQNVGLIKSIPAEYFERVSGAVMRTVQAGTETQALADEIESLGASTKKRAAFIARDQVSKATSAINRTRMEKLGIERFEWLHSGGGNARRLHEHLDGRIFKIDEPPVIDERTGERGFPGQLPNCRCRMVPIIAYGGPDNDE